MLKQYFGFMVKTNSYAGNFEREMCGYMTGTYGECEVGCEEAESFIEKYGKSIDTKDEPDEHGCYRPVEIFNDNDGYNSFIIHLNENALPSLADFEIMKEMAYEYAKNNGIEVLRFKTIGFELNEKETTVNKSNYEKYCEKEQPILLSKKCDKTLEEMIVLLRDFKKIYSEDIFHGMIVFVASLYERLDSEIEQLVDGKQYWIV